MAALRLGSTRPLPGLRLGPVTDRVASLQHFYFRVRDSERPPAGSEPESESEARPSDTGGPPPPAARVTASDGPHSLSAAAVQRP